MLTTLADLNALDRPGFVAALDGIYEGSPWVAEAAINAGPFRSRLDLLDALNAAMLAAPRDTQQVLIDACPDFLAADLRDIDGHDERHDAGLDTLTAEQRHCLQTLAGDYRARFGFRFIIALPGQCPTSIMAALTERLANDDDREFALALHEIGRIAAFRLARRVIEPAGDEALAMCLRLAWLSERKQSLICTALTPAHRATAALLREWMLEAGLTAHIDALGNVIGRWRCAHDDARTVMLGSHYDSAPNGGLHDGRLGIALALVVIKRMRLERVALPFDIEIVACADRHGLRFGAPFTSARALAGLFDPMVLARRDADGITFAEALQQAGHDPVQIPSLARDPEKVAAFIEIQPEHGPVLQAGHQALGVVSAILGLEKHRVQITGDGGHAGCVPPSFRHDAVVAAAEAVLAVEALMLRHPGVMATIGRLATADGAINAIAERCELSLDLRASDDALRAVAATELFADFDAIASRRAVEIAVLPIENSPATACAAALIDALTTAVVRVGGDSDVIRLPAGARHDAAVMAALAPVAMLLVRSGDQRAVAADDAHLAASALREFLLGNPLAGMSSDAG